MQFCDLKRQYGKTKDEIDRRIQTVLEHAYYVGGPEVAELEKACADYVGTKHALGASSGTDALLMSLMALGVKQGDFIATTPFTFIATAEVISLLGAIPLFVDIELDTYNIDVEKLDEKVGHSGIPKDRLKGAIPVDLYGHMANYKAIQGTINRYHKDMFILEDAAQSFGAEQEGKKACSMGDIAATSFFPAKPLGCFGDGGMVFTDNDDLYEKLTWYRNHGQNKRYNHKVVGINGRLDALQAAIVLGKFDTFTQTEVGLRNQVAEKYSELLKPLADAGEIILPKVKKNNTSVWAQYTIRLDERDELAEFLGSKNIPHAIHYPKPLHMQECFKYLGYLETGFPNAEAAAKTVISLPMDPYRTDEEIETVVNAIKEFFDKKD